MSNMPKIDPFRVQLYDTVRRALGAERNDIGFVKDRMILQADIVFEPFTADLSRMGRSVMQTLGNSLNRIAREIPTAIPWNLEIDIHSCASEVMNAQFPDKESQTQAQAMALREFFMDQGFPNSNILINAYGDSQLLDKVMNERAARRNRRVEVRLANPCQPYERDDVDHVDDGMAKILENANAPKMVPIGGAEDRGPRMVLAEEAAKQDDIRRKRGGTLLGAKNKEQSW